MGDAITTKPAVNKILDTIAQAVDGMYITPITHTYPSFPEMVAIHHRITVSDKTSA
jgi:hypothetical protein